MVIKIETIREQFPLFRRADAPVYFDSACQTLRPQAVIGAMNEYYEEYPVCADRSAHSLGERATKKIAESRKIIADFIGAKQPEEIIFTRNATEAINLVANSLGWTAGDIVLTGDKEHNSNLLPWMTLNKKSVQHIVSENLIADIEKYKPRLVATHIVSNLDGSMPDVKEIISVAHKNGALVLLDAAQAMGHLPISVRDLDADFLAFSGHKMTGPSGTGVLYGKYALLEKMEPFMVGGGIVASSTYDSYELLPAPEKFEAGLQNYSGIIGLAAAAKYIREVGWNFIEAQIAEVSKIIVQGLSEIGNVKLLTPAKPSNGIVSFYSEKLEAHQIMLLLDRAGICVRSGQFCVHSWFAANNMPMAVRASVYFYNTAEEAERFVREMKKIAKLF
jgi:cysteine desulfurase/selenocysteine lyase